jgi:hypothetical protein
VSDWTNSDPYGDTDSDNNTNSYANSDTDGDRDANGYSDTSGYSDTDANSGDANTKSNGYTFAHRSSGVEHLDAVAG